MLNIHMIKFLNVLTRGGRDPLFFMLTLHFLCWLMLTLCKLDPLLSKAT